MHVDPSYDNAAHGICEVAEAVTHARFVGTSTASDEVVLMKILKVFDDERERRRERRGEREGERGGRERGFGEGKE